MNESKPYSQLRAMLAITRASLRSTFRSPSAVAFSFAFPLFFILVFGFIGKHSISLTVGVTPGCDTSGQFYSMMRSRPELKLITTETQEEMVAELEKGKLDGIINFKHSADTSQPPVQITLQTSKASAEGGAVLQMLVTHGVDQAEFGCC